MSAVTFSKKGPWMQFFTEWTMPTINNLKTGHMILSYITLHHQTYDFWKRFCARLTKTSFIQKTTFGVISIVHARLSGPLGWPDNREYGSLVHNKSQADLRSLDFYNIHYSPEFVQKHLKLKKYREQEISILKVMMMMMIIIMTMTTIDNNNNNHNTKSNKTFFIYMLCHFHGSPTMLNNNIQPFQGAVVCSY